MERIPWLNCGQEVLAGQEELFLEDLRQQQNVCLRETNMISNTYTRLSVICCAAQTTSSLSNQHDLKEKAGHSNVCQGSCILTDASFHKTRAFGAFAFVRNENMLIFLGYSYHLSR